MASNGGRWPLSRVSEVVWRQLDPGAGRLSRRTVWWLRGGIVAAALLGVIATLAWRSGAVYPRLTWANMGGFMYETGPTLVSYGVPVHNDGWGSVRIVDAGRSGPGLELVSVQEAPPMADEIDPPMLRRDLGAGDDMRLVLVYRITDCAAIGEDP